MNLFAKIAGNTVKLFKENGMITRSFTCGNQAVRSAYVSGDRVNVQLANGKCRIYDTSGAILREF